MDLNKSNVKKKILLLITFAVLLLVGAMHPEIVFDILQSGLALLKPFGGRRHGVHDECSAAICGGKAVCTAEPEKLCLVEPLSPGRLCGFDHWAVDRVYFLFCCL